MNWIDIKEREPSSEEEFKSIVRELENLKLSVMENVILDCVERGLEMKGTHREVMENPLIIKINDRIRELYCSRAYIKLELPKEGE